MERVANILEGIVLLLISTIPFQLSLSAYGKSAYGLMILFIFFAIATGVFGANLIKGER